MKKDKINLLVVDDEEQFLASIKKRLELRDFNVIAVNRGETALEVARNQPIDIALVDLKMPGLNGEETLEALKREHEWMEVVILTGHGSVDSAVECAKKKAFSYLMKPCELDHLMEVLLEAYKKRAMRKLKIEEDQMDEILKAASALSPAETLRRIREIEKKGTVE